MNKEQYQQAERPKRPKFDKNSWKNIKRIFSYIFKDYKGLFFIVVICVLLSSLAMISVSLALKHVIDNLIIPLIGQTNPDLAMFNRTILILGLIFGTGVVANFLFNRLMVTISQGVLKAIRDDMFEHMQTLPIRYFDDNTTGSVMSLYTNDTDSLRMMINQSIPSLLSSFTTITVTFITMLAISVPLTLLAVVIVFVMLGVIRYIGGNSRKYFSSRQRNLASLTGFVEEHMSGQRVIKVFNHEEKAKADFDVENENLRYSTMKANTFANIMGPVMGNIGYIFFVLSAILGGILTVTGISDITIGDMAAYLQLAKGFTQPFMQMAQQFNSLVMALAGAERIFAMMDMDSEVDNGDVGIVRMYRDEDGNITECRERTGHWAWKKYDENGEPQYVELKGDVRFIDMDFGYEEDQLVLHDLNLYAKPGQKIAFVGSTGAGKTTIINLLMRYYDVDDGCIVYDGINLNDIKKDDLRKSLGIVLQDTHLFTGTVRDNIRYGNLNATDEQVIEAAKLAHAHQFIERLPSGYDTVLKGDGGELSQGQRQLLAIARAAVSDPPVLILDEATSSIDTRTESVVQRGMDNLMKGRTVFVIAHRLSTIKNSNAIIVLEHGRIIERGDHEDLIEERGTYYQLYTGKLELS